MMNWITTNIRLPEDFYIDLKMVAARRRTSVAVVMREKLGVENTTTNKEDLWKRLGIFATKMSKTNPKLNLGKKLVEMRYEQ